jgi:hypothetical protein
MVRCSPNGGDRQRRAVLIGGSCRSCGTLGATRRRASMTPLIASVGQFQAPRYREVNRELVFATYKKELIPTRPWTDLKALCKASLSWIEEYHTRKRPHSTLGHLAPSNFPPCPMRRSTTMGCQGLRFCPCLPAIVGFQTGPPVPEKNAGRPTGCFLFAAFSGMVIKLIKGQ